MSCLHLDLVAMGVDIYMGSTYNTYAPTSFHVSCEGILSMCVRFRNVRSSSSRLTKSYCTSESLNQYLRRSCHQII